MEKGQKSGGMAAKLLSVLAVLFAMFAVSGILLVVITALTYYMELPAKIVRIGILAVYVISGFVGGFLIGKIKKEKKFLWGLAAGAAYFLILFAASAFLGNGAVEDAVGFFTIMVLSVASAMIGGMVS